MTDKPTPKEMDDLFEEETGFDPDDFPAAIFGFARAVLAKWGQPVVAGDVDRADAVNLARNALTQYDCAITKKGVRVLAEAVLSMDSALTTPQPTQPQAAEPVAWLRNTTDPQPHAVTNLKYRSAVDAKAGVEYIPVFAAPQPVAREPLTGGQIKGLIEDGVFFGNCKEIVRAIEAAHGITQKGGQHVS